jgi:tetratricopeptide (TPR) repeat protein
MNKNQLKQSIKVALQRGEREQVELLSKEAVSNYPEEPFGYAYLAEALLMDDPTHYNQAELYLAKASQLSPENTLYMSLFATLKSEQGEEEAAQLLWDKILTMEPSNMEALLAKGCYLLYTNQDYKQAVELFDQAIQYHIDHAPSYLHRAHAYLGSKQYEKALNDFNHAFQLNNEEANKKALLLKLKILQGLNHTEALIETYKNLLTFEPDHAPYHLEVAELLSFSGRHKEAAEHYESVMELQSYQNTAIAYAWGEALYESQQYAKALKALELFAQGASDSLIVFLKQIPIYIHLGQYEVALQKIALVRRNNEDEEIENHLKLKEAEVLFHLKYYKEAISILELILQANDAPQAEVYYWLGKAWFMIDELAEAYQELKTAALKGHVAAANFLNKYLQDYLYQLQKETLEASSKAIEVNSQSSFIKKIKGKIWRFDTIEQQSKPYTQEQLKAINNKMALLTICVTEQGLVLVLQENITLFAYKINKETYNSIRVRVVALDQLSHLDITLRLNNNGQLNYQFDSTPNQTIVLKEVAPNNLDTPTKSHLKKIAQRKHLELLGKNIRPFVKAVWG